MSEGQQRGSRLDPWVDSYAKRTEGMKVSAIRALFSVATRPEVVSLAGGMPNLAALPMDEVGDMIARLVKEQGEVALQYGSGQGVTKLREQICEVMKLSGIEGHPDDVVVTTGSQSALDLVTRLFCDPGDVVLVEAPSYVGALGVFSAFQCEVVHVYTDQDGLNPDALDETIKDVVAQGKKPKLIYTIPSFQNPLGITQSPERRKQVLEVALKHKVMVLEDDPYCMLGFDGVVPRAIRADDAEGVIYLGSFSKSIASGLRVGWALAPHGVREKLTLASESSVLSPSNFSQMTVSEYLSTQPWDQQLKAFREMYRERRDVLIDAMEELLPAGCTWTVPEGGFFSWVTLPGGINTTTMLPKATANLVAYVPGNGFYVDDEQGSNAMRVSYCFPPLDRIPEGVRRLAVTIEAEQELIETFGPSATRTSKSGPSTPSPEIP